MTILRDSQLKLIGSELYFTGDDPTRAFRFRPESSSFLHLESENDSGVYTQVLSIDGDNQYLGIFNASPSYQLDVGGDTQIVGSLVVLGTIYGSGSGINSGTVSISALANIGTDTLLGRSAVGTGPVSTIACTAAGRALIDDASNSAQRTTLGLGSVAVQNSNAVSFTGGTFTGITDLAVSAGSGMRIAEGTNGASGVATLVAGTVTVNTTKALTNSRIHLTSNVGGGTPGWVRVSARVNGTSFTITSSSATDTSQVAWLIINQ